MTVLWGKREGMKEPRGGEGDDKESAHKKIRAPSSALCVVRFSFHTFPHLFEICDETIFRFEFWWQAW